jgi:hypothetical protein
MTLLQLLMFITPLAIIDSINPSAILLTLTMLIASINSKKIMTYILGILLTNFALGAFVMYSYEFFGVNFQFDLEFITEFMYNPPYWGIIIKLLIGCTLLCVTIYNKLKPKSPTQELEKPNIIQNSIFSFFILGVVTTGIEAATALPYFGAFSSIFVANLGFFTNLILVFLYSIIFVLPLALLVVIRNLFKSNFHEVILNIKAFFAKYFSNTLFYLTLSFSTYLATDAFMQLLR